MSVDATVSLIAGTVAGMTSVLVDYPLDTLKTRMQVYGHGTYRSYADCARCVYQQHGLLGFYKGLPAPVMAQGFENAILFTVYHGTHQKLRHQIPTIPPETLLVVSAAAAGAAVSVVLTPVEYIKCNMQVLNKTRCGGAKSLTTYQFVQRTFVRGGILNFFRGFTGTLTRAIFGNIAYFGSYEVLSRKLAGASGQSRPSLVQSMLAGGLSGCAYWTVMFPADVVKTRMQVEHRTYAKMGFVQAAQVQYRVYGIRGMYSGVGIAVLRSFPSSAIVFSVYELCSKALQSHRPHIAHQQHPGKVCSEAVHADIVCAMDVENNIDSF